MASSVRYRSDAQLIAQSDRVVHGRVISQRTTRGGPSMRAIYTVTTLAVIEDLTGVDSATIEVWERGGTIGNETMYVDGAVRFEVGAEVVVCLRQGLLGLQTVGMGLSTFDLQRAADGTQQLTRNLAGLLVVDGTASSSGGTLDEFRRLAGQVTGRTARRGRTPDAAVRRAQPRQNFTYLGDAVPGFATGARWFEADAGLPIRVYMNRQPAPPSLGFELAPQLDAALAAWTNPPAASLTLLNGGLTTQPSEGPWDGTIPSDSIVVSFEDPDNEINDPVLAITTVFTITDSSTPTLHGTSFDRITDAAIKFQNVADMPASFRQPLNFSRLLSHELGHTIGLGHTQTDGTVASPRSNVMYSTCCFTETPTPPALGPDDLTGLVFVYPDSTLTASSLTFGAITGPTFTVTSTQTVRLVQSGDGSATWSAASNQPWLKVVPTSGSGSAPVSISVVPTAGLPASGTLTGTVVVTFSGGPTASASIGVTLTLRPQGSSEWPFGNVDTPHDNSTGVTGAVPFTGWALDDVDIAAVSVCRAAVAGEGAAADSRCGGWADVYVGDAVFIEAARPDVQVAYPAYPRNNQAGWGLMVLTNMLPAGGNGTYTFSVWARDVEGHASLLGTRTLTASNANATLPFGTIDTPKQGETVSGREFVNFGWALTPNPKMIPFDGSTLRVYVDGALVGAPSYNHYRADIATLFPGLMNSDGAVGFKVLDTTTLTNGLHTLVWTATDSAGAAEGLGSRYFTVSNGAAAVTRQALTAAVTALGVSPVAPATATAAMLENVPVNPAPLTGRRGWAPDAPWRVYEERAGRIVVRGEELDRFELLLPDVGGDRYDGYMRAGSTLTVLPAGSRLAVNTFTWSPGVGFIGTYDLVFVRSNASGAVSRQEVRIIIRPKATGHVGAQVVIDTPTMRQEVGEPFALGGWAADLDAEAGTGIDTVHVWAYPVAAGSSSTPDLQVGREAPPQFVGVASIGVARPDVAAVHGDQFQDGGYGLTVQGLAPGTYDLAVFAWSRVRGGFAPAATVRVTVR